jgi:hypothetical protein
MSDGFDLDGLDGKVQREFTLDELVHRIDDIEDYSGSEIIVKMQFETNCLRNSTAFFSLHQSMDIRPDEDCDRSLILLKGKCTWILGREETHVSAPAVLHIPRGVGVKMRNNDSPRCIVMMATPKKPSFML